MRKAVTGLSLGLAVMACGPKHPSEDTTATESTGGPSDQGTSHGSGATHGGSGSDLGSVTDVSSGSSATDVSSGSSATDVSGGGSPTDPGDTGGEWNCPCSPGAVQSCSVGGHPGYETCQGHEIVDSCSTYWSNCALVKPLPSCKRQALQASKRSLAGEPTAIELVDLDSDGALDLVVVLGPDGLVEVAMGDGAGGFLPSTTYPTGITSNAVEIAAADFNMDGSPDLALTAPESLAVLFGHAGVFDAPNLSATVGTPRRPHAGDINGDGKADLLTIETPNGVVARLGDGEGGFQVDSFGVDYPDMAVSSWGIVVPDFLPWVNHGRILALQLEGTDWSFDILTTTGPEFGHLRVGKIRRWSKFVAVPVAPSAPTEFWVLSPQEIGVEVLTVKGHQLPGPLGDVDGDGFDDLALTSADLDEIGVLYFSPGPCVQQHPLDGGGTVAAAGDIDGDGKADLVVRRPQPELTILRTGP